MDLYEEYKEVLEKVSPDDVIFIVDELVKTGEEISHIKRAVNKILNVFYKSVKSYGKVQVKEGSFLYYLMAENESGREVRVPGSGNNTLGFSEANDLTFSLDFEEGSGVPADNSGYGSEVTIINNPEYVTDAATGTYGFQYNDSSYLQVRPPAPFLVNGQATVEVSFKVLTLPDDTDLISK